MLRARGKWAVAVGLLLAACGLLWPLAAGAAPVVSMTLGIQRQGEPGHTYYLRLTGQGDMAQYLLTASDPPGPDVGGFLLTRDEGRTWYSIDPARGACARWTSQDVAAALGGLVSKLKSWANLEMEATSFSKVSEGEGEVICGYPTRRYTYVVHFGFKASFLFSSWEYRVVRDIEVWATDQVARTEFRDWLMEVPLNTGHPVLDSMINQGLAEVKGAILKKRVRQEVTDKDGQTTRSEIRQTVTKVDQGPAPPCFAPGWTPPPCQAQSRDQLKDVIESLLKKH